MTSNYKAYFDHIATFAESHTLAIEAEKNVYPLFIDLKKLINHYKFTVAKFENVQTELATFIEQLKFDEDDFDYYQNKFILLRKADEYLSELKNKKIPSSIANEIEVFISSCYSTTSLYKIEGLEENILSYHNKIAELKRHEEQRSNNLKYLIVFALVAAFIIFLISKC